MTKKDQELYIKLCEQPRDLNRKIKLSDHCVNGCKRKRSSKSLVWCRKCAKVVEGIAKRAAKVVPQHPDDY